MPVDIIPQQDCTHMNFQVVVLAGGTSKDLAPLVSKEVPKPLLPVANRPVLSFILEQLEQSNLKEVIVVVEGENAALRVGPWISSAFADRLRVLVEIVPEDCGTAGAIRCIRHRLTANDVLIVSGDLVTDVAIGAVAATHRRHDAAVTAMLCSAPVSGPLEAGTTSAKDKAKKPKRYNIIGLDSTKRFLLYVAAGADVEKDIRVQKSILRAVGQMEIRADLMDAHLYIFNRSILLQTLSEKDMFHSLRQDVLPYFVRTQLKIEAERNEADENGRETPSPTNNEAVVAELLSNASPSNFHKSGAYKANGRKSNKCCVYIAEKSKYCSRLNSIQAYHDINRDMVGEANHISGHIFSGHNNLIDPSATLGSKSTVGPHCMVGEGSQLNDKCSVKRSVIGRHCRIGSNVKIVNSVVMNYVTIADGCSIQNCVVCDNAHIQERASLRDCQVGTRFIVTGGGDYKGEALAKKY